MKTLEQWGDAVGYYACLKEEVRPIYVWYAYKDGKAIKCNVDKEAQVISRLYERIIENGEAVKEWREKKQKLYALAIKGWKDERIAYASEVYNFPISVCKLIMSNAELHVSVHDNNGNELDEQFELECSHVKEIIELYKKETIT